MFLFAARRATLALTLLLSACSDDHAIRDSGLRIELEELARIDTPVWFADLVELNGNAPPELMLAGHRRRTGTTVLKLSGEGSHTEIPLLKPSVDRHACTAIDLDNDGLQDLYCTTGVRQGKGLLANEFWRNLGDLAFQLESGAHLAPEESARGRLTESADFDADGAADLVTTAWPGRVDDAARSEGKIWRNTSGELVLQQQFADPGFGARCLAIADIDGNSLPDILGCGTQAGVYVLLNEGNFEFQKIPLAPGYAKKWVWSLATSEHMLAVVSGTRKALAIDILSRRESPEIEQSIPCRVDQQEPVEDLRCERMAFGDVNGDGAEDLWITRYRGKNKNEVVADVPDLVLLGPSFNRYALSETASLGASAHVAYSRDTGFYVITAGLMHPGAVYRARLNSGR